ncbi:winged helix-turn-helix transcriptional regulator [Goodfellowiella coeruleoviolacea]|uniref:winged helix-turn-helix transcriptional regulator n=1 Tax=Goodfellowiella coeruleoviolacea TaxID=334858 RepID=UPI0020A42E59|nr:helix-turn-helix domain-containing protein [Goodfellowiella coeruleoviolacea]
MLPEDDGDRQFCPLAAGLDVLGDMWTVLVVRELLVAPATEDELLAGVPGLDRELLAPRLAALCAHGVVEWDREYRLTPLGRRLQGPLLALARWGRTITQR